MRFAVIDPGGDALAWAARLQDEGNEVLYYIHDRPNRRVGEGIVPKTESLYKIYEWAKAKPSVAMFMFTGFAKAVHNESLKTNVAVGAEDFQRAGVPILWGGRIADRLEEDRNFGLEFAKKAGIRIPPYFEFSSLTAAQNFCKMNKDKEWYFKTDKRIDLDATKGGTGEELALFLEDLKARNPDNRKNIVQMKIPGVALSTGGWFNGRTFLRPFEGTLEHKKFMNGEVGPSTGCAINVVWFYEKENPKAAVELFMDKVAMQLFGAAAPPGLYDVNAVVATEDGPWGPAGVPYFLEWTPRPGYDSEVITPKLLEMPLGEFIRRLTNATLDEVPFRTDRIAFSTRLGHGPYPYAYFDGMKKSPYGITLRGMDSPWNGNFVGFDIGKKGDDYYMADDAGEVGVACGIGTALSSLNKKVVKFAGSLEPKSLTYRTDGFDALAPDGRKLRSLGYDVPSMVVE